MTREEFLVSYMNEHYAHARDHEYLRGEITSILSAASFVLIGLTLGNEIAGIMASISGLIVVLISALNFRICWLHENRANAHMEVAKAIRKDIETQLWQGVATGKPSSYAQIFKSMKRGSLTKTWLAVPAFTGALGIALIAWHLPA